MSFCAPDPLSLELSERTRWPYDEIHEALKLAAEAGVRAEIAEQWILYGGPALVRAAVQAHWMIDCPDGGVWDV
jgi:hypothetical protein